MITGCPGGHYKGMVCCMTVVYIVINGMNALRALVMFLYMLCDHKIALYLKIFTYHSFLNLSWKSLVTMIYGPIRRSTFPPLFIRP